MTVELTYAVKDFSKKKKSNSTEALVKGGNYTAENNNKSNQLLKAIQVKLRGCRHKREL